MKVLEAINNKANYVITKNGEFLAIKNNKDIRFGTGLSSKEVLNMEVVKEERLKGLIEDVYCIRV